MVGEIFAPFDYIGHLVLLIFEIRINHSKAIAKPAAVKALESTGYRLLGSMAGAARSKILSRLSHVYYHCHYCCDFSVVLIVPATRSYENMTNFTNIVSCIASSGTPFKNAESRKFDALRFVISFAQYWKQSAHHLVGNLHFLASHHLVHARWPRAVERP